MKRLPLMMLVAAALVIAALVLHHRNRPTSASPELGRPLIPGLETTLAGGTIQRLQLSQGDAVTTLEVESDQWVVRELHDYPADFARLQRALLNLAEVRVGQVLAGATLDPDETVQVRWSDGDGTAIGGVDLGAMRQAPAQDDAPWGGGGPAGGRFVRRAAGGPVFLVRDPLTGFTAKPNSWVSTQLLSVPTMDIVAVEIEHPDGDRVHLARMEGDLTLTDLAEGEEFDTSKRHGVGGALSYLRFQDVADPATEDAQRGLDQPVRYRATTSDDRVYEVRLGQTPDGGSGRYARLSVSMLPSEEEIVPADESDAGREARETRAQARAELEADTAEEQARLSRWVFVLPPHSVDNMTRRRAEFIKDPPAPAAAEEMEMGGDPDATLERL